MPVNPDDWLESRDFYKCLTVAFANYFSGHHYLKSIVFDATQGNVEKVEKYFNWKFRKSLHLYNVLNFGWKEIKSAFEPLDFPLNTPGEAWIFLIGEEADYSISNSIEKTPHQKLYRMWLTYRKLQDNQHVSNEKISLFQKFIGEVERKCNYKHPTHIIYLEIFLGACRAAKNNKILQSELQQYDIAHRELMNFMAKNLQHLRR